MAIYKKCTVHKNKSLNALKEFIDKNVNWAYSLDIETTKGKKSLFFEYPSGYPIWISKGLNSFEIKTEGHQVPVSLLKKIKSFVQQ